MSRLVFGVLDRFTPDVERISIDEAFLDVTGSAHLWGGPVATARALRAAIREETGLTASVGVAGNKFLAKIASDMDKPDGLTVVPREAAAIRAFMAPLPIRRIWGVGRQTEKVLHGAALKTVADLQRLDARTLQRLLGERHAGVLSRLACGLDERPVQRDSEEKSISSEHTFGEDVSDWEAVEQTAVGEADEVGWRLRKAARLATVAHVKLRWQDFETLTRQVRLERPSHADRALRSAALELLAKLRLPRPVRLVGFGVSGLLDVAAAEQAEVQPDLFGLSASRVTSAKIPHGHNLHAPPKSGRFTSMP
jgi:DNA polymerase-4